MRVKAFRIALLVPMGIVLGAACIGVLLEAFLPRHQRWTAQVTLSLLTVVAAGVSLALYIPDAPEHGTTTLSDTLAIDAPALFLWGTLLALSVAALLLIADRTVERGGAFVAEAGISPGTFQDKEQAATKTMQTEVFPLMLFALGGMMAFTAANDLFLEHAV